MQIVWVYVKIVLQLVLIVIVICIVLVAMMVSIYTNMNVFQMFLFVWIMDTTQLVVFASLVRCLVCFAVRVLHVVYHV
jgi:hypothetical protein